MFIPVNSFFLLEDCMDSLHKTHTQSYSSVIFLPMYLVLIFFSTENILLYLCEELDQPPCTWIATGCYTTMKIYLITSITGYNRILIPLCNKP